MLLSSVSSRGSQASRGPAAAGALPPTVKGPPSSLTDLLFDCFHPTDVPCSASLDDPSVIRLLLLWNGFSLCNSFIAAQWSPGFSKAGPHAGVPSPVSLQAWFEAGALLTPNMLYRHIQTI